jgi:hypothetical protein
VRERERGGKGDPSSDTILGQMNQPSVFQGAQGKMYINVTLHISPSTKEDYKGKLYNICISNTKY